MTAPTQLDTTHLAPLASVIATTLEDVPVRLGPGGTDQLAAALTAHVAAYMGRELGPLAAVLGAIAGERERQDARWGEQNHHDGTGTTDYTRAADTARRECLKAATEDAPMWSLILLEEVYEALAESDAARLRAELVQVAAVACAWVEAIDRRAAAARAEDGAQ